MGRCDEAAARAILESIEMSAYGVGLLGRGWGE